MRFSFFVMGRSEGPHSDAEVIDAGIDMALYGEQLGFDGIFLMERHFYGHGPWASAPFEFGAYLAGRLQRAWLGFATIVTPYHHPVHLAEQMNLIDQLTKGRAVFGVGSGNNRAEGPSFGIDPARQHSVMNAEALDILEQLWSKRPEDAPVEFATANYRGDLLERVVPAPFHKRRPTLMCSTTRDDNIQRAARNGWPVFLAAQDGAPGVPDVFRRYRSQLLASGHSQEVLQICQDWTTYTFPACAVAASEQEAEAILASHFRRARFAPSERSGRNNAQSRGTPSRMTAGLPADAVAAQHDAATLFEKMKPSALYGRPEQVIRTLRPLAELGIGNVLLAFNVCGNVDSATLQQVKESMRLIATEVMPALADVRPQALNFVPSPQAERRFLAALGEAR